jgi:hypothetical protein
MIDDGLTEDERDNILQELNHLSHMLVERDEEIKRLRAALRECEAELNAYYRMEYPGDHPHSHKKLAQAMASNPATVALGFTPLHKETNND